MAIPNAAACAALLLQYQQNQDYRQTCESSEATASTTVQPDSPCTVVEAGRVVVKPQPNQSPLREA